MKIKANETNLRSGLDIVDAARQRGYEVTPVSNRWANVKGEHGSVNVPMTPRHLSKQERGKYLAMLKWVGIVLGFVLVLA